MDIGTLTGEIALEDQLSGALNMATAQVAKFAEDFDGLLGAVTIGATALIAAVGGITAAVTALGSRGANVNDLKETIDEFTGSIEESAAVMEGLRQGTRNTVDDFALMGFGAKTLQAGVKLTADEFQSLGEAAFVMANRGLGSVTDNLGSLQQALVTGRTRGLAMKLGVIETKDATEAYAKSIGKTKDALNDYELAEAKRHAVMELVSKVTQSNTAIQDDFNDRIAQASVKLHNFIDELASAVDNSPVVAGAMTGIGQAIMMAFGGNSETAIKTIVGLVNDFAILVVDAGLAVVATAQVIHVGWSIVTTVVYGVAAAVARLVEGIITLESKVANATAKLMPWSESAQEAARTGQQLADEYRDIAEGLVAMTEESAKGVTGQSAFDQKLAEVGGSLFVTRDRLKSLTDAEKDNVKATGMMNDAVSEFRRRQEAAAAAADKASEAQKKANQQYREFKNFIGIREMEDYAAAQRAVAEQIHENITLEFAMNEMYIKNDKALGNYTKTSVLFERQWTSIGLLIPEIKSNITDSGRALDEAWGASTRRKLDDIDTILTAIPGKFSEIGAVAARTGKAIIDNWASGNFLGAIVAGATGLVTVIAKLFGRGEKGKVDDMRQALIDASGGWDKFNRSAHDAGMTLEHVLNARTVKDYQAAVEELNTAIQFQDDAMKLLDDTVQKYGFSIEELGPKFSQQKLNEQAGTLLQDYQVLSAAAIDHNAILEKMAPSMYAYIESVIKAGGTIPNQLKDPIEQMAKMGLLVDEAGQNMVDVSKLTFAETLDEKFTTLIDTIHDLVDAITRGLGGAIANIPIPKDIHIPVHFDVGQLPNPSYGGGPDVHYGAQGDYVPRGSDSIPAMIAPGERILSVAETQDYEAKRGTGGQSQSELAGFRRDMMYVLPGLIADATATAMIKTGIGRSSR